MAFTEVLGLCHFVAVLSLLIFVSQDMEWEGTTLAAVATSRFAAFSPLYLGMMRAFCAIVVWATLIYITFSRKPLFLTVLLRDGKKRYVSLLGTQRYAMFTVWCWTIQGYFFVLSAYCSFAKHYEGVSGGIASYFPMPSTQVVRAVQVLFEVSFPVSFLVSSLVTFVLIPHAKRAKMPIDNFFVIVPLLMHNVNIIFMAIEFVTNEIPFAVWHFPFIVLYGMSYAVFSWAWNYFHGYYFYFFMDYTRPGAVLWYIALLVIVGVFFMLGCASSAVMNSTDSIIPALIIGGITASVIKVSD